MKYLIKIFGFWRWIAAALPCDALPSDHLPTVLNINNPGNLSENVAQRGAFRINESVLAEATSTLAHAPATPCCDRCRSQQAAIAELSAALTLLYTWSTRMEPLPASLHDEVKRAFAATVMPCFERPYAERVSLYEKANAEQKSAPASPKKPFRMNYRGFLIRHSEGGEPGSRTHFEYSTVDGAICGLGSSVKACKKMIDQHFVETGQSRH